MEHPENSTPKEPEQDLFSGSDSENESNMLIDSETSTDSETSSDTVSCSDTDSSETEVKQLQTMLQKQIMGWKQNPIQRPISLKRTKQVLKRKLLESPKVSNKTLQLTKWAKWYLKYMRAENEAQSEEAGRNGDEEECEEYGEDAREDEYAPSPCYEYR